MTYYDHVGFIIGIQDCFNTEGEKAIGVINCVKIMRNKNQTIISIDAENGI